MSIIIPIQIYVDDNIIENLKSNLVLKVKDATDLNENIFLISENICNCFNNNVYSSFYGLQYQIKNTADCLDTYIYMNSYLRRIFNVNIDDEVLCVFFILNN